MKTTFALRRLEDVGDAGVCGHHDDLRLTRVGRRSRESPPSRPAPRPGLRIQLSRAGIHVNRMLRPSSGPHKGERHQVTVAHRRRTSRLRSVLMRSGCGSGWLPGREDDNWMQAERELRAGCGALFSQRD